jgi:Fur family ferric uptake transcriptional regulator
MQATERKEIEALLNSKNLRITSARIELLSVFKSADGAISGSSIHEALSDRDRVTVYRTIQKLLKVGVLHKALEENNEVFYALCNSQCTSKAHHHDHIHFKCVQCGEVDCIENQKIPSFDLNNYKVEDVEVFVKGYCPNCLHLV